ncbi:protein spaetzle 3 [Danaus plexippus]|uniref:protein spaetzle 3 n=1 Tax=Danaus plexippus TaxID=13037 RepID=UPI000239CD93|nr:protein spaetzle 3 [Danaus plexippus]
MALANFTVATSGVATPALPATTAAPFRVNLDDLLYSPEEQQAGYAPHYSGNEPFTPPNLQQHRKSKVRKRAGTAYLPPPNQFTHYPRQDNIPQNPFNSPLHSQIYQQNTRLGIQIENQRVHDINSQFDNNGQYVHDPTGDYDYEQKRTDKNMPNLATYNPGYVDLPYAPASTQSPLSSRRFENIPNQNTNTNVPSMTTSPQSSRKPTDAGSNTSGSSTNTQVPPDRPRGFTKVETGGTGGKTQLHAILDYDDDYYEDVPGSDVGQAVTPLQGPILLRNGTVPVVPLTSYPTVNNGSFYQIPILWTALSLALGYELQGQVIRGVPCVKRNFQLYCPTAGNTYPLDKIETFIDENKALIKRMYGSFTVPGGTRVRRAPGVPDMHSGDSYFRHIRQTKPKLPDTQSVNNTGRIDACESKTEIMTPYWALNSARKVRAIVNTMHFEQAIHQEVCSKKSTSRCSADCGCEQKYKWHRLLAYDPNDDCAGIFMDWFLFPSCCVCRCKP